MDTLRAMPTGQRPGTICAHALCLGVLLSCGFVTGARAEEASGVQAEEAPAQAGAAADGAGSRAPAAGGDAQKQALVLLDQALTQAERAEWHEAAHTLERARKLVEFPNIVFHLARAYLRLHDTRRGLEELARFEELAGPFNPNRAEAERLRAAHTTRSRFSGSGPERRKLPLGPLLTVSGGGAALVTALVTGLLADAAADELKRNCGGDDVCPSYLEAVRDHGQRLKLTTNVLLGVGAAAVAVGTGWWLLGRRERAHGQLACSGEGCRATAKLEF